MSSSICGSPPNPSRCRSSCPWHGTPSTRSCDAAGWPCWWGGVACISKACSRDSPPRRAPQAHLRKQFRELGQPLCHALLAACDPLAAQRIAPADTSRTTRALEVVYATGQACTSQQRRSPPPWPVLELGLNPGDLPRRIQQRTQRMYEEGLVAETASLISRHGDSCPLLDTMGYDEARRLLRGELEENMAIAYTEQRTRQYAKRQRTWFRRQHHPLWLEGKDLMQQAINAVHATRQGLG